MLCEPVLGICRPFGQTGPWQWSPCSSLPKPGELFGVRPARRSGAEPAAPHGALGPSGVVGLLCRPPARGLGCGLPHCPVRLGDRRTEGKGGGGGVPPLLQLETSSPLRGSWQWEREPGKEKNLEFPLLFSKHHKTPFCVWSQNPSVGAGAGGRAVCTTGLVSSLQRPTHCRLFLGLREPLDVSAGVQSPSSGTEGVWPPRPRAGGTGHSCPARPR